MAKILVKIYLEDADKKKLMQKAQESGFNGKGSISHYIEKIVNSDLIFMDDNAKKLLKSLGKLVPK